MYDTVQEIERQFDRLRGEVKSGLAEVREGVERNTRAQIDDAMARLSEYGHRAGAKYGRPANIADQIFNSPEFKAWAQHARGRFVAPVNPFPEYELKSITSLDVEPLAARDPQIYSQLGLRRFRVRDLLPVRPLATSAVQFLRETATLGASPQTEGDTKAESSFSFDLRTATVQTIAHTVEGVSRQALDDLSQLREYLGRRMVQGLADAEDYELLLGDGTGVHLEGLCTAATPYDTGRNVSGDTKLDKLSHALAQLAADDFAGSGVVLHPDDWESIRLLKNEQNGANTGTYILGSPMEAIEPRVWGVPIAVTTAMQEGTFLVLDGRVAASIWLRMDSVVDISTESGQNFQKNLVSLRAEERLALAVQTPPALIVGSF
jgi:hypothetical protein